MSFKKLFRPTFHTTLKIKKALTINRIGSTIICIVFYLKMISPIFYFIECLEYCNRNEQLSNVTLKLKLLLSFNKPRKES